MLYFNHQRLSPFYIFSISSLSLFELFVFLCLFFISIHFCSVELEPCCIPSLKAKSLSMLPTSLYTDPVQDTTFLWLCRLSMAELCHREPSLHIQCTKDKIENMFRQNLTNQLNLCKSIIEVHRISNIPL